MIVNSQCCITRLMFKIPHLMTYHHPILYTKTNNVLNILFLTQHNNLKYTIYSNIDIKK